MLLTQWSSPGLKDGRAISTSSRNLEWSGESLAVGPLGMTAMWCEPQGRMDQESAYLALLGQVETVWRDGELLVLEGPDGRLTFVEPEPVADQPLAGTVWELETLVTGDAAQSVLAGSRITIEFGEYGRVNGSAGCNSYGTGYTLEGEAVSFDRFAVTAMACLEDGIMEQEANYLALLQAATTLVIEGQVLTLRSEAGELIFRPAKHLGLEGVDWALTGIATGEAVVGTWIDETITARFEAGQVTGSAGCNNYFADYAAEGATLALGPAGSTRMACEEEIMEREAEFLAALETVASYETRLETLSLYDAEGGLLLQFHAAQ